MVERNAAAVMEMTRNENGGEVSMQHPPGITGSSRGGHSLPDQHGSGAVNAALHSSLLVLGSSAVTSAVSQGERNTSK